MLSYAPNQLGGGWQKASLGSFDGDERSNLSDLLRIIKIVIEESAEYTLWNVGATSTDFDYTFAE